MKSAWAAHRENITLKGEIKQLRAKLKRHESANRCVYCGNPCRDRACKAHTDLLAHDHPSATTAKQPRT